MAIPYIWIDASVIEGMIVNSIPFMASNLTFALLADPETFGDSVLWAGAIFTHLGHTSWCSIAPTLVQASMNH